jgi:DNA-binding CsgD family transcriptional regulator
MGWIKDQVMASAKKNTTRTVLLYAVALGLLVFLLKVIEYRYFVRDLSLEFYLGLVAILFMAIGVWAGLKITGKKNTALAQPLSNFTVNEDQLRQRGISKREYEVLGLMARGLSNQEIADVLFVSLNTVKTHTSNLFLKLDAKRRTQAIQQAKAFGLIP